MTSNEPQLLVGGAEQLHHQQLAIDKIAQREAENKDPVKIWKKFFAGGVSATAISVALNSADHVKTRLQIQQGGAPTGSAFVPYKSFGEAFGRVYREEGLGILIGRGLASSAMREMSYSSVRMGLYDFIKPMLSGGGSGEDVGLLNKVLAGGLSGAIGSYLANPFDLVKIRQQGVLPMVTPEGKVVQAPKPYKHTMDALIQIYRTENGFRGLYRGVSATVARAAVVTGVQLSSYDHIKHTLINHTEYFDDSFKTHMVASTISGLCTSVASNPIDVVKTRYMNDQRAYAGVVDCMIKTIRIEGVRALFKGFIPNYIRLGSHCMFTLPLYEQMRKLLGLTTL